MSQETENNINRVVHVEKEGFNPRSFTLQQLKAMGEDPGGESYDGWKIVNKPQTPPEISDAAKLAASKPIDAAPAKGKKRTKKEDTPKVDAPVIPIVPPTNIDSHEPTGEKQESGERDGVDPEREAVENPAQGSEGNE